MKAKGDVKGLIKALSCKTNYWREYRMREEAACALVEIGTTAVAPLIAALEDSNGDVRKTVVGALGNIGDARAVEPLIAALEDSNRDARTAAAEALGRIGDARAVAPLIAAVKDVLPHEKMLPNW
jgi:HEAT repeat protein